MNKMIGLLLLICVGLWAIPTSDRADVVQQPTLEARSGSSLRGAVYGKPLVSPDVSRVLLWDQAATQEGIFVACQWDSVYPFEAEFADNFVLASDAVIDYVVWWGGFWGGAAISPIDFWIKIYPDSGAGLGPKKTPIYTQRVPYTETFISTDYYYYEAAIPPFNATGGVTYWIVFEPTLIYPPQWGNNCAVGLWGDGIVGWTAFELLGITKWTISADGYESSFQLYGPAPPIAFWDFEDGLQGWIHTNGQAFPAGWDVEASGLHSTWTPPDAGDSTMWIDSDDAGSATWVQDTAISPAVAPTATMGWLVYGVGYNWISSGEFLEVGLKYFDGSSWNVAPLITYTADTGPMWDSLEVSAYSGYDSVRVYFYYDDNDIWAWYAAFDNVGLYELTGNDVGCTAVTSPPAGTVSPGDYDVIGRIQNFGGSTETFDVTADVYDTTGGAWTQIFTATVTLTDFAIGGDSLVNFGQVTFGADKFFYTEIYTLLGDDDPSNDTSSVYSKTAIAFGDVILTLDAGTPTGDLRLLGVEFDGTYFYLTGARDYDSCFVYVLDTTGTLIHSMYQPDYCHGTWGWRDIAWDYVYAGPDRIDTLYASVSPTVEKFGIDLSAGTMDWYGEFPGPENPNRALAYDGDDWWFFTGNFSGPCYKFDKANPNVQSVTNPYAKYGAAYDYTDSLVWWHSQDDPGTGWDGMLTSMDPVTMTIVQDSIGYMPDTMIVNPFGGVAGGLCFWDDFRGMEVLFALIQGTPDGIAGIFLRWHQVPGVEEQPYDRDALVFGFAPNMANPMRGNSAISYTTTKAGKVSLKVYDGAGRLVETLVNATQPAGTKTVNWDARNIPNGVYFLRLEAEGENATQKMILVK